MKRTGRSQPSGPADAAGPSISAANLAKLVDGTLQGNARALVSGIASLTEAGPDDASFISSNHYLPQLRSTKAGVVIVRKRVRLPANHPGTTIVVDDADLAVARVLEFFAPPVPHPLAGIDESARVAPSANLGDGVAIGPFVSVGERVRIGARCRIHAGVAIGDDTVIGDDCVLFPNVVVRERITIGARVVIHAGSVIGSDGFGYRWDGRRHAKVPQIGTVIIEDDVEIGSCVCIDRAKFSVTRIGTGTKIDNLVQIAHNVTIGPHCIIVGQVGLAGSSKLGTGVVLGGGVGVRDHVSLGDGVMVGARSAVAHDIPPQSTVTGLPAIPQRQFLREQAAQRRLPELIVQMRAMQDEIEKLKARLKD
jgi:UDP-3-O-[3-hydroxymyristoyl] glucosamine N-acyltransferase